VISVTLPIKAVSVLNERTHWAKKAARAKLHRTTAWAALRAADKEPRLLGPVTVTVTRIAPRPLDSHDNLRASAKNGVDGIADWLGVKDNDPRITWVYAQSKGAPKTYAVRVEVSS
jgi:hypothetical protein